MAAVRIQSHNFVTHTQVGGDVQIQLDDKAAVSLGYRAASDFVSFNSTQVRARLLDARGNELAAQTLELLDGRDYVLAAAGNGESEAHVLNVSLLPEVTLALPTSVSSSRFLASVGSATDLIQARFMHLECGLEAPALDTSLLAFRQVSDFASAGTNFSVFPTEGCTSLHLSVASTQGQRLDLRREFVSSPGQRLFVAAIGGDRHQPLELHIVNTGVTQTFSKVPVTKAMEGLWYDPRHDGEGLVFLIDPNEPERTRLRAFAYGYSKDDGASRWALSQGAQGQLEVFSGGSPNGATAAARIAIGTFSVAFASCKEAYLFSTSTSDVLRTTAADASRNRRLVKLLPLEDCVAN